MRTAQISGLRGLPLVAVCALRHEGEGVEAGEYFFQGRARVRGHVSFHEGTSLGEQLVLHGKGMPWFLSALRFDGSAALDTLARAALHPPPLSESMPCWKAEVLVELRAVHRLETGGKDSDGAYATRFHFLQIGPFRACSP